MTDPKALTEEIKARHFMRDDGPTDYCHVDSQDWPCDAVRAADALLEVAKDTERLDWLESRGNGIAVVHDDESQWAVATDGFQNIRSTGEEQPAPLETAYVVEPEKFRDTIRDAIDAARNAKEVSRE